MQFLDSSWQLTRLFPQLEEFGDTNATVKVNPLVRVFRVIFRWGCPICFSLALLALSMFDYLPWYAAAIIICVSLFLYWGWTSTFFLLFWRVCFVKSPSAKKEFYESLLDGDDFQDEDGQRRDARRYDARATLKSIGLRQGLLLLVSFVLITFLAWFFSSVCFTFAPVTLSFQGLRSLTPNQHCSDGPKPCHVYLNVADNTSSSIFVVFHTTRPMGQPTVFYDVESGAKKSFNAPAALVPMDLEVPRYVYVTYLSHLVPKTTYYVIVGDGSNNNSYSSEFKFQTTDATLNPDFTFVSGGDVGATALSPKMLKLAAQRNPAFISFGGDLAYANGMKSCYRRWDDWLHQWTTNAITPTGHMIPLLTAIGNHEAGGFKMSRAHASFYPRYFFHQPFNTAPDSRASSMNLSSIATSNSLTTVSDLAATTPPPNMYHAHAIPGGTFFSLDSYVLTSAEEQRTWLEAQLKAASSSTWRMALYHLPMYPSARSYEDPMVVGLRDHWGPLFGAYNVQISFENHDHTYKRSYPLLNGQRVASGKGTVFIGDGSMGVTPRPPANIHKRDYLVHASQDSFFLVVTLSRTNASILAINERDVAIDNHLIPKL